MDMSPTYIPRFGGLPVELQICIWKLIFSDNDLDITNTFGLSTTVHISDSLEYA